MKMYGEEVKVRKTILEIRRACYVVRKDSEKLEVTYSKTKVRIWFRFERN